MDCLECLTEGDSGSNLDLVQQTRLLLKLLKVGSDQRDLNEMVMRRYQCVKDVPIDDDIPVPDWPLFKSDSDQRKYRPWEHYRFKKEISGKYVYHVNKRAVTRIRQISNGSLTANFADLTDPTFTSLDIDLASLVHETPSLNLMHNSTIVGLLCIGAKPDDYLVRFGTDLMLEGRVLRTCLLLREFGQAFVIFGQALILPSVVFCQGGDKCSCKCLDGVEHAMSNVEFEIHFSKDDLVAFAGQDLRLVQTDKADEKSAGVEVCPEMLLNRLVTNVTTHKWSSFALHHSTRYENVARLMSGQGNR